MVMEAISRISAETMVMEAVSGIAAETMVMEAVSRITTEAMVTTIAISWITKTGSHSWHHASVKLSL
jgi:hypothetical protein